MERKALVVSNLKKRPVLGDRVEFQIGGVVTKIGTVIAVAETGVHFIVEVATGRYKKRHVGLSAIIRIIREEV